jgi:uncharacterized membrane protein YbhN (UPF0104 family)
LRKSLLWILQFALTAGLLWLVFRDPSKQQVLKDAVRQADWRWLAAGVVAYGFFELLAGVRWQILLRVQGIRISWTRMYGLLMVGLFFSLFIPGGTGGDLVKGYYLLKEAPVGRKTSAALSVVMDRLLGLLGVAILTGTITGLQWEWLTSDPLTKNYIYSGIAVLGVCVLGMAVAGLISALRLVHALPEKLPGRNFLASVSGAYALYGRAWLATLAAVFISILAHGAHYTTFYCAGRAIEMSGPRKPTAVELYSALPVIETVAALPITPGGLGTREKLFDDMLTRLCDLDEGVAPSISMLGYFCIAFWGVVGGIFYMFYRPGKSERDASFAETTAQLGAKLPGS